MATLTIGSIQIGTLDGHISVGTKADFDRVGIGTRCRILIPVQLSGEIPETSPPEDFEIAGRQVFFNPALFNPIGSVFFPSGEFPRSSYFANVVSNTPASYPMTLQGTGENFQSANNGAPTLVVISATQFNIAWNFYLTADIYDYIVGQFVRNDERFTKNGINALDRYSNTAPSVYNQNKQLGVIVAVTGSDIVRIAQGAQEFRGNFYNEHVDGNFSDINFELIGAQSGTLQELSEFEDVTIRMTAQGVDIDTCRLLCWREVDRNQGTFENQIIIADFEIVDAPAGSTNYGAFFKQPSVVDDAGGNIVVEVTTDHTLIDPTQEYHIAILIGYTDGTAAYQSFSPMRPYSVTAPPPPVDLVIVDYFADLNNATGDLPNDTGGGKVVVHGQDRIECGLLLDRTAYNSDVQAAGYGAGYGNDFLQFVLTFVDDNTGEVLHVEQRQRLPGGTFGNDSLFEYENIGDYERIRWRSRIPGFTESNIRRDWSGRSVRADWQLRFFYGAYTVNYTYSQELWVSEYDNTRGDAIIEEIIILNGSDGLPARDLCDESYAQVIVKMDTSVASPTDYNLIALVDNESFGNLFAQNGATRENEQFAPSQPFGSLEAQPQLQQSPIFDADTEFDSNHEARFKVDVTNFQENLRYAISAIAKPKP